MTLAGWIFLAFGWGGVAALCTFCLVRTLRSSGERSQGPDA